MKIGILPNYNESERPFLNTFSFVNNYAYRIFKNNALPFGILFPNKKFNEKLLKEYDGFIIPGGKRIFLYHILTIHYCTIKKKPLLGICLGEQAIGLYSYIIYNLKKQNKIIDYQSISKQFSKIKENDYLIKVKNHNKENPFYMKNIENVYHIIYPTSKLLKNIYGNKIKVPSLHEFSLKIVKDDFFVAAYSSDGFIEAIEYIKKPLIIGVQFHPELEDKNDKLFKYFINACK